MKKIAILAAATLGSLAMGTTSANAYFGICETTHMMEIAGCGGDDGCEARADRNFIDCLKRQVTVNQ